MKKKFFIFLCAVIVYFIVFCFKKPISYLSGLILFVVGKIFKRRHLNALGHYLLCTGRHYWLSDKEVATAINQSDYLRSDWYNASCVGVSEDLYNTLGKFRMRKTKDHAVLFDLYQFYPTVDYIYGKSEKVYNYYGDESHDATWNEVSINKDIPNKIRKYLSLADYDYNHLVSVQIECNRLRIEVSDKIFENNGKPFYVRGRCKISDLEKNKTLANYMHDVYEE